jgi:hypothetical protein
MVYIFGSLSELRSPARIRLGKLYEAIRKSDALVENGQRYHKSSPCGT